MLSPRLSAQLLAGTAIALVFNATAFADSDKPAEQQVAAANTTQQSSSVQQLPSLSVETNAPTDFKVDTTGLNKLTAPVLDTPQTIQTISK